MTKSAYQKPAPISNPFASSRSSIGGFEVIVNGDVYPASDIVTASMTAHQVGGKLFEVFADATKVNGFRRHQIQPLPLDIARNCSNRVPRKAESVVMCVPVWR